MDVARQLAAQHNDGEVARIVLSQAVMLAAGLDTHATNWREIVLPSGMPLNVTSLDDATALLGAESVIAG
jgi:hypothetical protein